MRGGVWYVTVWQVLTNAKMEKIVETYNVSSYGETVRVNFNRDVSGAESYSMSAQPERGETVALSPVTLGTADVWEGDASLLANQYVEYTTQEDDFKGYVGRWRLRGEAKLSASVNIATDYRLFRVTRG